MSRSGYSDDLSEWALIRWRGAVASAIRGKRGQRLLREMLDALDAMPEKRLIAHDLERDGEVCALGAVGRAKEIPIRGLDSDDYESVAATFGVAPALVQEIAYFNDEVCWVKETPEQRWVRMRKWIVSQMILRVGDQTLEQKGE